MIKRTDIVINVHGFELSIWQDTKTKLYNFTYDHKKPDVCIYPDKTAMCKNKGLII